MKKFIIIGGVIVIGVLAIWFLIKNQESINSEFVEVGSNLSVTPEAKQITNLDSAKDEKKIMNATLHTNKGDITIEFFDSQTPKTVANFLKLAKQGFYVGTKFHRVIKGFMIQGGDPLTKDDGKIDLWGTGGPGYSFADELGGVNKNNKNDVGTIAMANSGPNTNGSQFFINTANNNFLDDKHVVFGKVTTGMDVVTKIENISTTGAPSNRPLTPVIIESISLK